MSREMCLACGVVELKDGKDFITGKCRICRDKAPSFSTIDRYPSLRTIARIFTGLAYLVGVLAVIGMLVGLRYLFGEPFEQAVGITFLLQSIIGGSLGVLTLLAVSGVINVLIDIEENTRTTARASMSQASKS